MSSDFEGQKRARYPGYPGAGTRDSCKQPSLSAENSSGSSVWMWIEPPSQLSTLCYLSLLKQDRKHLLITNKCFFFLWAEFYFLQVIAEESYLN